MIYKNRDPNPSTNLRAELSDITPAQNDNMPFLFKIPGVQFDIDKLRWLMDNIVLKHEPVWAGLATDKRPNKKYGGWTLTSNSGDIKDGWQGGAGWKDGRFHIDLAYKHGYLPRWYQTNNTPICVGYFLEVIDTIANMGFYPRGARIWTIPPGGAHIGPHTDNADNSYSVRLHIPILSNDRCTHEWYADPEDYITHMPADGSAYLFRTNILHDTFNRGTTPRYHFVAEVWDTKHVVPEFGYDHIEKLTARYSAEVKRYLGREL